MELNLCMNELQLSCKGFSPKLLGNDIASEYKSRIFEKEWTTRRRLMMAGSKNVGTRLGWRDGCVGRRLWKATDGRRRLYTRYTILPPNHHHHLLMPSYATLSSSKTISCRDCGHEGRPALCDLIAAWSDTYYGVTRHLRSCSAFNRYSMPDNLRVCPGSSVVLRTNSSRD